MPSDEQSFVFFVPDMSFFLTGSPLYFSTVLERKISMRKPRQELIDKGVLKEISENGT